MNTKNFIKDCLYIKLSTKLCPITLVAPSHAWKLLAAAAMPRLFIFSLIDDLSGEQMPQLIKDGQVNLQEYRSLVAIILWLIYALAAQSADDDRDICRPSTDEVSYFATFGTYIIRRDDIGS